jgi:N-acetylglucosamine kinase-like BadF-type ATPase
VDDPAAWVIGIDAGGTHVRVAVAAAAPGTAERPAVALFEAQGPAMPDGGPEPVASLLGQVCQAAGIGFADVGSACAGIAKISRNGIRARWESELRRLLPGTPIIDVVPDFVIAFHGATGGVGVAVVAGTGSVIYGENGRGGAVRVGGRGWEYGDEGSGAWLTTEMVRRTLHHLDGLRRPTRLSGAVCATLDARDAGLLTEEARRRSAAEGRGFLVPVALRLAHDGDTEAKNLFVGAAGWLGLQACVAAERLQFAGPAEDAPRGGVRIATVGGLWEAAGELLRVPFTTVVRRRLPEADITAPLASPAEGAIRRAAAAARIMAR